MNDNINTTVEEILDDSFSDESLMSEPDDEPLSVNVDLQNGWPFDKNSFLIIHFNINSVTVEGCLDELADVRNVQF